MSTDPKKSPLLKLINNISFFEEFSESERRELIEKHTLIKKYENKGSMIFEEGHKGGSIIVILSGEVKVIKSTSPPTQDGRISLRESKNITLANLGVGAVMGEVSLLTNKSRTTGVVTSSDLVIVMEIKKNDLENFNASMQAKFQRQFILILIERLEDMNKKFGKSQ